MEILKHGVISMKQKRHIKENVLVFLLGGALYPLIEVVSRGYTHWTMAVLGGTVFLILYRFHTGHHELALWKKCLFGAAVITGLEFVVGCIANLYFDWHVWDYSGCLFNVLGQVCLPFSAIWFALCAPAYALCGALEKALLKGSSLLPQ